MCTGKIIELKAQIKHNTTNSIPYLSNIIILCINAFSYARSLHDFFVTLRPYSEQNDSPPSLYGKLGGVLPISSKRCEWPGHKLMLSICDIIKYQMLCRHIE